MSPDNMRRRIRSLERRLDAAGSLFLTSWLLITGAAAFFVAAVAVACVGWGIRWLM